jgi:hypothetical protein
MAEILQVKNIFLLYLPVTVDEVPHVLLQFLVGRSDTENFFHSLLTMIFLEKNNDTVPIVTQFFFLFFSRREGG